MDSNYWLCYGSLWEKLKFCNKSQQVEEALSKAECQSFKDT